MPVEITNKRVYVTDSEGKEFQIPEQMAQVYSDVKIVCDGPNCAGDGSGPTTYEWDEHKVQTGEYTLPDQFHQMLTVQLTDGKKIVLCGHGCAADWLKATKPLGAPKIPVNGKTEPPTGEAA